MGMRSSQVFRKGIRIWYGFNLLHASCWILAVRLWTPTLTYPPLYLAFWGLSTALLSFLILDLLEYFDSVRLIPSPGSIVTLCLTLPWPALLCKYLFVVFFNIPVLRYREILTFTPGIALA